MEEVQVLEHRATVRFRFPEAPRSGREVLRLEGVRKAFGARVVYRGVGRARSSAASGSASSARTAPGSRRS